jgi:hypothetical protein
MKQIQEQQEDSCGDMNENSQCSRIWTKNLFALQQLTRTQKMLNEVQLAMKLWTEDNKSIQQSASMPSKVLSASTVVLAQHRFSVFGTRQNRDDTHASHHLPSALRIPHLLGLAL